MNYKLIANIGELKQFIEWLPDLKEDEVYYFQLFARKKYCDLKIKNGHNCMARFAVKKEHIFERIQRLESESGSYTVEGHAVPNEALALYINPNPRSHIKAAKALMKTLVDRVTQPYNGYKVNSLAYTELHRSAGTKYFVDFDFDLKEDEELNIGKVIDDINTIMNPNAYKVLSTRGGYHVLVRPDRVEQKYRSSWYQNMLALGPDATGDNMIPCPGTYCGGFAPYFIS